MRTALFTTVRNEKDLLPVWLRYYGRSFDSDQIFVLDHQSNDGSIVAGGGYHRVPIDYPTTEHAEWLLTTNSAFQRFLLTQYDRVVFAEVDEFLVPDPERYRDFGDYLAQSTAATVTATGYDIVDVGISAVPIDWSAPLLAQRPHWRPNPGYYNKTLIATRPLDWTLGFHHAAGSTAPDPDLRLLHLHYFDREAAYARMQRRLTGKPPDPGPWGYQNKYGTRHEFDRNFSHQLTALTEIPAPWRALL